MNITEIDRIGDLRTRALVKGLAIAVHILQENILDARVAEYWDEVSRASDSLNDFFHGSERPEDLSEDEFKILMTVITETHDCLAIVRKHRRLNKPGVRFRRLPPPNRWN